VATETRIRAASADHAHERAAAAPRVLNSYPWTAQGYLIAGDPYNPPFDNKLKRCAIVQACRPVDGGFHDLSSAKESHQS
jgi:hypothetical protein